MKIINLIILLKEKKAIIGINIENSFKLLNKLMDYEQKLIYHKKS